MSVGTNETTYNLEAYKNPNLITLVFVKLSWLISEPSESDGKTAEHANKLTTRDSVINNTEETKN